MTSELDRRRREISASILRSYRGHCELNHLGAASLPNREEVWTVVEDLLRLLFPGFLDSEVLPEDELEHWVNEQVSSIERRLAAQIRRGLSQINDVGLSNEQIRERAWTSAQNLLLSLPAIRDDLVLDMQSAYEGDPAAPSLEEIVLAYPGLQAIAVHRMAHVLFSDGIPMVPRVMSEYAHSQTGIDLHPGATIGRWFFIDHGTGVVVGETAVIGDHVRIYQGVTLGASRFERGKKRHPTIEDQVTIYSGATILGDISIGEGSIIGGNAWVTRSVPPHTKVVVRPPQQVHSESAADDFQI